MPDGNTSACHWNALACCIYVLSGSHTCLHMYVCGRPRRYIIITATPCCCATPTHFWVPLQSRTHKPDFPFQKLSGNLQHPRPTSFCPPPYCDAASYTSTLPTQKTTQTPPPQAVKPYYYYYYLLPTYCTTDCKQRRCLPLSYLPQPALLTPSRG
jgi:hypothetical protein